MKYIAIALTLVTIGCAQPRHVMLVSDTALYEVINDIHQEEQTALCGQVTCKDISARMTPTWTNEKSKDFNRHLLPVVAAGKEFNHVLATWKEGQPMPAMVHNLISGLNDSLKAVITSLPDGTTKTNLLTDIAKAQSIVLSAIDLVSGIVGGN